MSVSILSNRVLMVILSLTLALLCVSVELAAQVLPPNNCSNVFRYERWGFGWIGIIVPEYNGLTRMDWTLKFSAHGYGSSGQVSQMALYPNRTAAYQNIFQGGRAECYVTFQNYGSELPKIIYAQLNGQVLCTAIEYGAPSLTITRSIKVSIPTRTPVVSSNGSGGNTDITVARSGGSGGAKPIITVNTGTRDENPATDKCGMEGLVGLLIGGETLPHGRFPWMAALYHDDDPDPKKLSLTYKCVATLISSRTVVTAAHCIWEKQPEEMRVYVGRHDLDTHPETGATLMEIQSAFTHPDFVGNLVPDSDIGLLIFTTHVQESNYVRAICMWTSSTLLSNGGVEDATIGGWGNDENGKPTRFPKAAVVQTVSRETCLREMVSAKDFLTPRTLCAGNKKAHGPCLGDSGAGLMIQRNGRWMLRAIVSLAQRSGDTCDLTKYVIYSDVASHLRWIESKIVR
ncbi:serine protease gd-like isoform X1 [Scaptodrosophila lebanonensis]|uniref:Serine protease gd-like isoform X1 n=1 Tax=Drosophila lebanonensis TaxID=7225 RepID=A0A6J2T7U8_DROLE|nr:serine protease gd-like isoform X1 [Scaptodrosophila lebanonensis]